MAGRCADLGDIATEFSELVDEFREAEGLDLHRAVVALAGSIVARGGIVAVLHESATRGFASLPFAEVNEVMLVVGPEGGIDDREIARLTEVGATPVMLGPTVLRTSTAGAVARGGIGVLTDRWGQSPVDL